MKFYQILPILLLCLSLAFIGMALYMLIRKKPILLSSLWVLALLGACFLPQILLSVQIYMTDLSVTHLLPSLLLVVLMVWLYFSMQGYTLYGVKGEEFQKALIEYLNEKGCEFEQTVTSLKIKEPEIELYIAVQSWIGTGQIRPKGKKNREFMDDLVNNLRLKNMKVNRVTAIFYLVTGLLVFALSVSHFVK